MTASAPTKTITILIDEMPVEIKMTYGLLNELLTQVQDLSSIGDFFSKPEVRNAAFTSLLSIRSDTGKVTQARGPEDVVADYEDLERLLAWAVDHVTNFFIRNLIKVTEQINRIPAQLGLNQETASQS